MLACIVSLNEACWIMPESVRCVTCPHRRGASQCAHPRLALATHAVLARHAVLAYRRLRSVWVVSVDVQDDVGITLHGIIAADEIVHVDRALAALDRPAGAVDVSVRRVHVQQTRK